MLKVVEKYLRTLARLPERTNWLEPSPKLKLSIVIPSLAEFENLPEVLRSLQASRKLDEAEVLVVVNHSDQATPEVRENDQRTLDLLKAWPQSGLRVLVLDHASTGRALPHAQAGVGLARRLGLDAALARLAQAGSVERSALAWLDADSPVAPGYIDALLAYFEVEPQPLAGICLYQHTQPTEPAARQAIQLYVKWLEYLEMGLTVAGSLFAFPAIGSCVVVSARGYTQVHGIEPRKAAEDFHFLRKLQKLNGPKPLGRIPGTMVYPSARISNRVPFGTGKAMSQFEQEGPGRFERVDPPEAFFELRAFFQAVPEGFHELARLKAAAAPLLSEFLEKEGAWEVFSRFQRTYPGPEQFHLAIQHWLDSLRIIRFLHRVGRIKGQVVLSTALADLGVARSEKNVIKSQA